MPGHLFIVQGDLTRIACDAWLLPTSPTLWIENHWLELTPDSWTNQAVKRGPNDPHLEPHREVRIFHGLIEVPPGWGEGSVRTFKPSNWPISGNSPQPWLTGMAITPGLRAEEKAAWFAEGARQFVVEAAKSLDKKTTTDAGRTKPLLALPVVGTGQGGGSAEAGIVLRELLRVLMDTVESVDADVVMVTHTPDQFAAAQQARRDVSAQEGGVEPWNVLPDRIKKIGKDLAAKCLNGQLVLFLGAGVSVSAGLPTWSQLLAGLADDAQFTDSEKSALKELSPVDQAHLIRSQLERRATNSPPTSALAEAISKHVRSERYGLQHALLANLPVREVVTTNYDTLFEDASRRGSVATAVLPYGSAVNGGRWLLKLHGCVTRGSDIVLTREDYLRYSDSRGALAGIVQALLITRHMLFVGFSLTDDNFHRIVDEVRKVRQQADTSAQSSRAASFGTSLLLETSSLLTQLWQGDIDCVSVNTDEVPSAPLSEEEQKARILAAANQLEILLDYISFEANQRVSHVLDMRYDGLLSEDERQLRDHVCKFESDASDAMKRLPAWRPVAEMLRSLGAPDEDRNS